MSIEIEMAKAREAHRAAHRAAATAEATLKELAGRRLQEALTQNRWTARYDSQDECWYLTPEDDEIRQTLLQDLRQALGLNHHDTFEIATGVWETEPMGCVSAGVVNDGRLEVRTYQLRVGTSSPAELCRRAAGVTLNIDLKPILLKGLRDALVKGRAQAAALRARNKELAEGIKAIKMFGVKVP